MNVLVLAAFRRAKVWALAGLFVVISVLSGQVLASAPLSVSPASPPNGEGGVSYSQQLTITGGTAPYIFTTIDAPPYVLPLGVTLSTSGLLSGMPTTAGTYTLY